MLDSLSFKDHPWFNFFIIFFLCLIDFFLLIVSRLYSNEDLFKFDFENVKKQKEEKFRKLLFIFRSSNYLFVVWSILQLIIGTCLSVCLESFFETNFFSGGRLKSSFFSIFFSANIIFFLEFLSCSLISDNVKNKFMLNDFILNFVFFLSKIFFFLKRNKKITEINEKNLILYIKNLSFDNIVEKKEADLVKAAFNFDDLIVENIMTPMKKVICLDFSMKNEDVQKYHLTYSFSFYPVIDKQKKIKGILNFKKFFFDCTDKKQKWQQKIEKNFIEVEFNLTLDKLLDKVRNDQFTLALVKKKKENIGIITAKDIFNALIRN